MKFKGTDSIWKGTQPCRTRMLFACIFMGPCQVIFIIAVVSYCLHLQGLVRIRVWNTLLKRI